MAWPTTFCRTGSPLAILAFPSLPLSPTSVPACTLNFGGLHCAVYANLCNGIYWILYPLI